ncbi:MAG TPA: hypothetical protein VHE35_10310, partial [Kofleriaceae bacterium]|nr:hypothetical protein [Kofleriaceae bacterium]
APLACTACHDLPAAAGAPSGAGARLDDAPMPPPAKARCAPCHDGALACQMTGHRCAACHGGRVEAAP